VTTVGWVGEVAAEIDRLVVAVYARAPIGERMQELGYAAHPGIVNGFGASLLEGPIAAEHVSVLYPYLPERLCEMLIDNNVEQGVITREGDQLVLTERGVEPAVLAGELLDGAADAMWAEGASLDTAEAAGMVAVFHGRSLEPPMRPSAFAATEGMIDRPTQAGRVFRVINALRYWRADAHRAAWTAAGLNVQEAHALNRLWDIERGLVRVGQGEERPGRTGVAGLVSKGFAMGEAITNAGVKAREAIEADTDARNEPIFATLADPGAFLEALQNLRTPGH
jgi:hypothetical protein